MSDLCDHAKNVLIVSNGYPSKRYPLNGIFAYDQAKALAAAGVNVAMACVDLRSIRRTRKWGYENFVRDGINIYCINIPIGIVPKRLLAFIGRCAFKMLYRKVEEEVWRPNIIHAHFYTSACFASDAAVKSDIPLIITEHSSILLKKAIPSSIRRIISKTYPQATKLIAVSQSLSKRIEAEFGVSAQVIPNIVQTDLFEYVPSYSHALNYISVGNLIKRKGMDILIKAFVKLLDLTPKARLTIIGNGPMRSELKALVAKLELAEYVTFTGRLSRPDIAQYFAKSDFFVLSSRSETFGVVYIEAMATGLPVIATRCGGPEDFIDDTCGVLVPVDDVDALASAMYKMSETEYDREYIANQAKQLFSPNKIASDILELYKKY